MQRHGFRRLYGLLLSLHQAACTRISVQRKMTKAPASPILIFAAVTLSLILAILEIDLHRSEMMALVLVVDEDGVTSSFAGP